MIPVVSLLAKVSQFNISEVILSISSVWIIVAMLLNNREQNYRLKAATLQEKYDNNVFGLMENKTLILKMISPEEINFISENQKENEEAVYYSNLSSGDNITNILISQRQNVLSDRILRKMYLNTFKVLLTIVLLLCISFGMLLGQSLTEFLIGMLLPTISLISLITQHIKKLSDEIKKNEQVGQLIEIDFQNYCSSKTDHTVLNMEKYMSQCREYQKTYSQKDLMVH